MSAGCARLNFPRRALVGPGSVEHLGEEAARLGRRALLVTGRRALREAGTTARLVAALRQAGLEVTTFEQVPPEPQVGTVDLARARLREAGCDLVVGAGGGSALDVAKAAAALAREEAPTAEFQRGRRVPDSGLPHMAVPTTAGTGAEATLNSVLVDPERLVKQSVRGPALLPDVCIVDPELTLSCPPAVTAASGMDALCQAIESYLSVHAVPLTEALSLEAARLIARNLPVAHADAGDRAARQAVSEGSFMAGVALANARLGAVHGIAHPLGLLCGLPHGVVCAALLPHVLARNAAAVGARYDRLREAMGGDPVGTVEGLLERLGLPRRLCAVPDAQWERRILDYALSSGSSRANPVPVDEAYVRDILRAVCS